MVAFHSAIFHVQTDSRHPSVPSFYGRKSQENHIAILPGQKFDGAPPVQHQYTPEFHILSPMRSVFRYQPRFPLHLIQRWLPAISLYLTASCVLHSYPIRHPRSESCESLLRIPDTPAATQQSWHDAQALWRAPHRPAAIHDAGSSAPPDLQNPSLRKWRWSLPDSLHAKNLLAYSALLPYASWTVHLNNGFHDAHSHYTLCNAPQNNPAPAAATVSSPHYPDRSDLFHVFFLLESENLPEFPPMYACFLSFLLTCTLGIF